MPLPTAIACFLLAIGFLLLFFGNRLSQWGFMVGTVCLASVLATGVGRAFGLPQWQLWVLGAVGAGLACLMAALLFRLWMGVSGMVFMAVLVVAVVVIWQGPPLPHLHSPTSAELARLGGSHAPGAALGDVWADNESALRLWWEHKNEAARQVLRVAMAIGGILGLGLGLAAPLRAAALQCATAGAGLCLVAVRQLVELHAPQHAGWLPETPRAILLVFLVIAAVGFAAQSGGPEKEEKAEKKPPEAA